MLLKKFLITLLILFILFSNNTWAQDNDNFPVSTLTFIPSSPPFNGKQITYTREGIINTITHYKKGEMIRYRNYLMDGGLFQDFRYKNGLDHGKYHSYNELAEIVIKGKKKNGLPYSGKFDQWDHEIKGYRILTYKRGKVINNILLVDFLTNRRRS